MTYLWERLAAPANTCDQTLIERTSVSCQSLHSHSVAQASHLAYRTQAPRGERSHLVPSSVKSYLALRSQPLVPITHKTDVMPRPGSQGSASRSLDLFFLEYVRPRKRCLRLRTSPPNLTTLGCAHRESNQPSCPGGSHSGTRQHSDGRGTST